MPAATSMRTVSSEPVCASLVSSVDEVGLLPGSELPGRADGCTTRRLKGVGEVSFDDPDGFAELEDFGPEIAADQAEEVETGLPEIWVVRRSKPVRLPVEDVPDPRGRLTVPGTAVPRVEELVFPGLTLIGTTGLGACTEGFEEGRAGVTPEGGGERATHSSTSTYQAGGSGGAGTGSK